MELRDADGDAAAERIERRWFAAFKAASAVRSECEALLDQMEQLETAWHDARIRLANIESLRDELGNELAGLHSADVTPPLLARARVMTAA